MLNEVHIEGIVVRNWRYQGARFLRVACYPDPGRTLKRRNGNGREEPEYLTLRFEPPLAMAVAGLAKGDRLRASGYLASREYGMTLTTFAENARGDRKGVQALRELASDVGGQVVKPHVLNEVVVERFLVLSAASERGGEC